MRKLSINSNKSGFLEDGKTFFWLADTIWSAFTNVREDEWSFYLKKRRQQGFNVLQIDALPQWDRCRSDIGIYPFETKDGVNFDFSKINEEYFEHAAKYCRIAAENGFHPAVVVLWSNFVPGTWASKIYPAGIMPKEFIRPYVERLCKALEGVEPIFIISGDTDFDTEETIEYYDEALKVVEEMAPDKLKGMHIKRGYDVIPDRFVDRIDFYLYQSGHNVNGQDMAWKLAETFRTKYPKKPVINGEPCYEQMGFSRNIYGRFDERDCRNAAWTSILAGASAGITYGAHGIWNWMKPDMPKNPVLGEGFDSALPIYEALNFPGAWDFGMLKEELEKLDAGEITPAQELIDKDTDRIRAGKTQKGDILIYVPNTTKLKLRTALPDTSRVKAYDLAERRTAHLSFEVSGNETTIEMPVFTKDMLYVIK
ncbi:MAG: DUF4038 domain-containing protein [Lachnospiraceae bacterium]|nr:DUF4038 domain-containing protein [Lachnospiraceae bacterium]